MWLTRGVVNYKSTSQQVNRNQGQYYSSIVDHNFYFLIMETRERRRRKQVKVSNFEAEEVSSKRWEFISMSEQEEDLICRMYRLVGQRWDLIAGRIPGRTAEEIERYWIMKHHDMFPERRK